ncbi:hypothetical protein B0H66DRAFT_533037 [Apodospora peruviana]|uniref:Uncharacterized protein n=1 Tax=Apodospora peruviana TaxID=516989 RepID=A0AAE0I4Y7_9PEZI|nr:hypothetical protein B0H66DRAFT_533037 [Apodospora peruviana]
MAARYSAEFLLHLRQSPLCVKPAGLPPAEEWMGPPPETFRNQTKPTNDRIKGPDSLLNQENRRPPLDRNGSRNSANPDEIILGPPKTSFASATSLRNNRIGDADKGLKDTERSDRPVDRFNFRTLNNDPDGANDRYRDTRDGRNNTFRRRGDQDQDSEGWSTVKPRKSFGHEGAERFHGRMGGAGDRFGVGRDDRRPRDRDDRDPGDRRNNRNPDHHTKDKESEPTETTPRRNGLTRGKTDNWYKDSPNSTNEPTLITQRERIDRAKSWRDRIPGDDKPSERQPEKTNDRNYERRWDREQRVEREPEWLDEPAEEKSQGKTAEDFKKFMETMKAASKGVPPPPDNKLLENPNPDPFLELEQKVVSAPAVESGPDKFFEAFGSRGLDVTTPTAEVKEVAKPKGGNKSRFMAFLAPQEEGRPKTEPSTPAVATPGGGPAMDDPPKDDTEKVAFAQLIQKLHRSGLGPPDANNWTPQQSFAGFFDAAAAQSAQKQQPKSAVTSPEPFQQYGGDRREEVRFRLQQQQHPVHDVISPRPQGPPAQPLPVSRPEQALHELVAQRHNMPLQTNNRMPQNTAAVNSNTEFLMRLMQSHRDAPDPPRTEQLMVRMPQPTKQVSVANIPDREQDYQRERSASQRQLRHQQGPPGFLEDQFHPSAEMDNRQQPQQPTQILQRPPPPGLEHHMMPFPMGGGGGGGGVGAQLPPQQRPMIPPPGLVNGPMPPRNMPMPGIFPPNFPAGAFPGPPPPDGFLGPGGPPPRSMQPPPGFLAGPPPPPGFIPPGMGMAGGFQGVPEAGPAGVFGGGMPPFDRRGMMPPGAYRGGP